MAEKSSRNNLWFFILTTVAVIIVINLWILNKLNTTQFLKPLSTTAEKKTAQPAEKRIPIERKVIRKEHLDPSRTYSTNIFYIEGQEIGRFKSAGEKIYDVAGTIPEGQVEFINLTKNTHGLEFFRKGKRHRDYREYYENGNIRMHKVYFYGKLMKLNEYFIDGQLRMEANYEDALLFTDSVEVGVGKIYFRDGTMMYEWNITNANPTKYTRAYNIKGQPVETKYFDQDGKLIKTEQLPRY